MASSINRTGRASMPSHAQALATSACTPSCVPCGAANCRNCTAPAEPLAAQSPQTSSCHARARDTSPGTQLKLRSSHLPFKRTRRSTVARLAGFVVVVAVRGRRCGAGVGVRRPGRGERHDPAHAHDDARRVSRRCRALRDVVRVQRSKAKKSDRSCRCPASRPRSSAAAAGRCNASSAKSHRRLSPRLRVRLGRSCRRRSQSRCIQQTKIDALDITILKGGGDDGREVGRRSRLPAHAGRARDARLLLAPQPDLHGRALQRERARAARAEHRRRHADHADDPDARTVGAAAHPEPRSRQGEAGRTPTCSSSPTRNRSCSRAGPA